MGKKPVSPQKGRGQKAQQKAQAEKAGPAAKSHRHGEKAVHCAKKPRLDEKWFKNRTKKHAGAKMRYQKGATR